MEMYSPLLGMSSDMPLPALKQTYKRLLKEYENDEQLIDLVNNTYQYFLNEILKKDSSTISSIFEEENKDTKKTNKSVDTNKTINETASNESNSKELVDHFEFNDVPEKTIHKKPTIKDDPEPVSYTHLDVYKRQILGNRDFLHISSVHILQIHKAIIH